VSRKLVTGVCAVLIVLVYATNASADSTSSSDPHVTVGRDGPVPQPVTGPFLTPVDANGGGIQTLVNATNEDIVELILSAELTKNDKVTCTADSFFGDCTVSAVSMPHGLNSVTITLDDPLSGGITPGAEFFIELNDVHGKDKGGWKKDGVSTLSVDPVFAPEPGGLLLLMAGLGCASVFRKLRQH
jgi:hypothetical protein